MTHHHHDTWTLERLGDLRGSPVYDRSGEKIGKVEDVYHDYETRQPEWIGLGTGFFSSKRLVVPIAGAEPRDDGIVVPYEKERVKDAPEVGGDDIAPELEADLYRYYGIEPSTRHSDTVLPGGERPEPVAEREPATSGGAAVTRSEEELHVGKREVPAGGVRLRKWVEEEPAEADVELTRERAHVERERVDEPVAEHEFREETVEVPLRAEEPVVEKEARARERVGVRTERERDTHTVEDTVRKERVDVDGVEDVDDVD